LKLQHILLNSILLTSLTMLSVTKAIAGPADYIYTPMVEEGEREIDFKFGTAKAQDGTRTNVTSLGFGYGATSYWFTELYLKHEREGGAGLTLVEWENKFQLTETGKYPVDIGLITEIEAPLNSNSAPWEFKIGPLMQTEFGKLQLNGNLLFERKFAGNKDDNFDTEMGYQWQAKYRLKPSVELGLQAFGELGKWNDWAPHDEQNHRLGPAIFGQFTVGQHQKIKYNTAWLLGLSDGAPNHTVRMQLEYEF
jgi:hypothetical protein